MNPIVETPRHDQVSLHNAASIFLAGTIDMGASVDWQQKVIDYFVSLNTQVNIYNPRRVCFEGDEAEIDYQINWELRRLGCSDIVFFNFLPNSKSPITLLELGMVLAGQSETGTIPIVVCPKEFYRAQNVWATCRWFGIEPLVDLDSAIDLLHEQVESENARIRSSLLRRSRLAAVAALIDEFK